MIRAYGYAAIVAASLGLLAWGTARVYRAGGDAVRVEWAQADAAAAEAARLYAKERANAFTQMDNAALAKARRASFDRAGAAVAGVGLRYRTQAVAARCDSELARPGGTASSPGNLLADVQQRLEEAGRELAATADERGIAGTACQDAYSSLKGQPATAPDTAELVPETEK